MRVAGGEWQPLGLADAESDAPSGPVDPGEDDFVEERAFVRAYSAAIAVPDSGAWIDLRVTATEVYPTGVIRVIYAPTDGPAKAGYDDIKDQVPEG